MNYLLVIDYPHYTDKKFYKDIIEFKLMKGALAAKLFTLTKFNEKLNSKTLKFDTTYEIGILQLNIIL